MPVLHNARQEKFAQAMAKGLKLEAAHREAGYSGTRNAACNLTKNVNIAERIAELQANDAKKAEFDRQEYQRILKDRFTKLDPSDATTAKYGEMLARSLGYNEPEKIELTGGMEVQVVVIGGPNDKQTQG